MKKDKKDISLKSILDEILIPMRRFYKMQYRKEILIIILLPVIIGILCFCIGMLCVTNCNVSLEEFTRDVLSDFITIMVLFVSFTMGYLSIITTSSSENVNKLKLKNSEVFKNKKEEYYSLYQILTTDITYSVIIQIGFLLICIMEKFMLVYLNDVAMKVFCAVDVCIFTHIALLLIIMIKNIYYSFWKSI